MAARIYSRLAGLTLLLTWFSGAWAACEPTPNRPAGTHFKPITTQRADIGSGLTVRGRVLAAPDCKPIAQAKVAHWQAGSAGRYEDRLRAYLFSQADGGYQFQTEWPGTPVPHIHFIVEAAGYETLTTQWIGDEPSAEIQFDVILRPKP